MNNAPRVNYLLPILATLGATLLVMGLFILLAFFAAAITLRQLTTSEEAGGGMLSGAFCGLVALGLVAAILFFSTALINGLRDLTQPLQVSTGRILRKYTGLGRTGGFWIVVAPVDGTAAADPPSESPITIETMPTSLGPPPGPPAGGRSGPVVQAAPTTEGSFGAGLTQVDTQTRRATGSASPPVADLPPPKPVLPPGARTFRVDKLVYQALNEGEVVSVAYSRYLEHIYYIAHPDGGQDGILRNTSLI